MEDTLLDEILAEDLLGQEIPSVLGGGVLHIDFRLHQGGNFPLQGDLLFCFFAIDDFLLPDFDIVVDVDEEASHEDILGLSAGDSPPVGE